VVNSIVNFSSESGLPDSPKESGIFFVADDLSKVERDV